MFWFHCIAREHWYFSIKHHEKGLPSLWLLMQRRLTQEVTHFYHWPDKSQSPLLPSDPCGSYNPKMTFGVGYRLPYGPMNKLARENTMNSMVKAAR